MVTGDLTEEEQCNRLVDETVAKFGKIHVLVGLGNVNTIIRHRINLKHQSVRPYFLALNSCVYPLYENCHSSQCLHVTADIT